MKAVLLLAPLALLAFDDAPGFAPEAGTQVQKTFSESTTLTLESTLMSMNGEEQDSDGLEMEIVQTRLVTVTDTYQRVADGRAALLARTFDAVEAEMEGLVVQGDDDDAFVAQGTGDLAGHAVVFTWDPETGRHVPTFAEDDDGDEDLLEGLEQDMDLLGFLPPADAKEGAQWDVSVEDLRRVLRPGGLGPVPFEDPGDGASDKEGILFLSMLSARDAAEEIEGEVSAEWVGSVDVDGRTLAKITLEIDVVLAADVRDWLTQAATDLDIDPEELDMFEEITIESAIAGEGVLLWDVEAGHVASLELGLENELLMRLHGEQDMGGGTMEMSVELQFAGTTDILIETR